MEKEIEIEREGKKIEASLHSLKNERIVVLAHGFTSNKDRERYVLMAEKLSGENIDFLRFNFGGSGNSYNTEIDIDKQVKDLKAVLKWVKERGYKKIGILGESLGGLVTLKSLPLEIDGIVFWAPVTNSKTSTYIQRHPEVKEELDKNGRVVKKKDGREFILPKKYFEDRENVDAGELSKNLKVKALILHGDNDKLVDMEDSKIMANINNNLDLEIIGGEGHKLAKKDEILEKTIKWFKKHLK